MYQGFLNYKFANHFSQTNTGVAGGFELAHMHQQTWRPLENTAQVCHWSKPLSLCGAKATSFESQPEAPLVALSAGRCYQLLKRRSLPGWWEVDAPSSFTPCCPGDVLSIQEYKTHMCDCAHPHECEGIPRHLMPGLRLKANQEGFTCNGYSGPHHRGPLPRDRLPGWLCLLCLSPCLPICLWAGLPRCGLKDGETLGQAIRWWHGWEAENLWEHCRGANMKRPLQPFKVDAQNMLPGRLGTRLWQMFFSAA